ncbi:MAG TPA: KH domain-containing protein, partial [Mycoplasmatales bacterium]|nr:KH domain-containing protein [Mycoplasmatales bacterium]
LTCSKNKIFMIEMFGKNISEKKLEDAINFALEQSKLIIDKDFALIFDEFKFLEDSNNIQIRNDYQKIIDSEIIDSDIIANFKVKISELLEKNEDHLIKKNKIYNYLNEMLEKIEDNQFVYKVFNSQIRYFLSNKMKRYGTRIDDRRIDQIRDLKIDLNYLPFSNGSCLFSRGMTEVLSVVTFGKPNEKQIDNEFILNSFFSKNFIHHYNFPSFSVGEISGLKFTTRREIGHGSFVERTFSRFVPSTIEFPYTTRVVSEVLSAEGSTSQASICSTSLALMSSGFPLEDHVAGIALGFFDDKILVDIDDLEDWSLSSTDFKISGTKFGICSLQVDVKENCNINLEKIPEFLEMGKIARLSIINKMETIINKPISKLTSSSLKYKKIYLGKNNIKFVIGKNGSVINSIILKTKVKITFEEDFIIIHHLNEKNIEEACEIIEGILSKSF